MASQYQKIKANIKALRAEAAKLAKACLYKELVTLFAEYPEVVAVRWRQYTPSFNDGDPCTFTCHAAYCELSFRDKGDPEEETDFTDYGETPSEKQAVEAFQGFLEEIDEEDMLTIFGDGVEVTIDRDGETTKEEYYD